MVWFQINTYIQRLLKFLRRMYDVYDFYHAGSSSVCGNIWGPFPLYSTRHSSHDCLEWHPIPTLTKGGGRFAVSRKKPWVSLTLAGQKAMKVTIWVFPKIMVPPKPPNHPFVHRVFHYFHHPFWVFPYVWKHPYRPEPFLNCGGFYRQYQRTNGWTRNIQKCDKQTHLCGKCMFHIYLTS